MNAVVIGCGRVGSSVAKGLAADGWDVTVVDEDEDALGTARRRRGAEGSSSATAWTSPCSSAPAFREADAAVVATDGDNTNIVIGQVLTLRYGIETVVVRVLDPARAKLYSDRGMRIVCPTQTAISELLDTVRAAAPQASSA